MLWAHSPFVVQKHKSCHRVVWGLERFLTFTVLLLFIPCSNISMLEEMGWRKPSSRRARIWNLSNTLSAFILNLQMPWSRNIYAPKLLKVSSVSHFTNISDSFPKLLNIKTNRKQQSGQAIQSHAKSYYFGVTCKTSTQCSTLSTQ